jgi:LysM repeat protein
MKKIQLLAIMFLFFTAVTFAQQKKYISYEVKKGETLKSIAKGYNLSTKTLSKLNPGVSRKPVLGTVIIVPNKNYGKATTTVKKEGDFYTVKPKETLFGISKKFGITIDELKNANPKLKNGVKIGMELAIPKPTITQAKDTVNYVIHTVVKDDTFYNLTKRYNVSETNLQQLNPTLKDGLKLGMLLKIKPVETKISSEVVIDSIAVFEENLLLNKEINVAIILPYQLKKLNDSIVEQSFEKTNSLLNIATDFHLGTEMAIDSLRKKGLKINAKYFDSENSTQKLQILINKNQNFSNTDVIIGPLFFNNAHWVANHTKTIVVAPLYSKKQATLNSKNLIKSKPSATAHQKKLLEYLEKSYKGENILIINDGKTETQSQLWQMVNKIKMFDSIQEISVIKPENGYINYEKFYQKLDSTTSNWVIIASNEIGTTSTTINNLKGFAERIEIDLFALNKGKNFGTIDNAFLGKLNFTYPTSDFLNADAVAVNNFYKAYRKKNNAFPSKYAIRGFDVTYDILARIASNNYLAEGIISGKSSRISSVFNYAIIPSGSFENNDLFLIKYNPDLTIDLIE